MSKNRYGKMQGNMQYNRPSGGYQKNMYKQMMNQENVKAPKTVDQKTLKYGGIAVIVVWAVITGLLIWKMKWIGLLIGLLIALAVVGGFYFYMNYKQKEMITYYKKIGMTEEMYLNELRKRGTDKKQVEAARKVWRKVKAESVVQDPRKKK